MDLTINGWRYVEAHFYHRAMYLLLAIFTTKPANTTSLNGCDYAAGWLLNGSDYKWLTLRWGSFLWRGNLRVACHFPYKAGQYFFFEWMRLCSCVIADWIWLWIFEALLMLISMKGQCGCCLQFSLLSRPILLFWMDATMQTGDCWIDMTINCWRSVDTHLLAYLRALLKVIGCSRIVQKMHTASIGSQYTVST